MSKEDLIEPPPIPLAMGLITVYIPGKAHINVYVLITPIHKRSNLEAVQGGTLVYTVLRTGDK